MLLLLLGCLTELDDDSDSPPEDSARIDADGDGFGALEDCNDEDPTVFPGAEEACNGQDDDCDGVTPGEELDDDSDGMSECEGDCDDARSDVYLGAPEPCDYIDNNCNGEIDEDGLTVFYGDGDEDGYGNPEVSTEPICGAPEGHVPNDQDCDDANNQANPGMDELCSTDFDDDCDGEVNENDAADVTIWYADADKDDYGAPDVTRVQCEQPEGYVANDEDCDDTLASVHPGAEEECNRIDDDCDGALPSDESDDDSDGTSECEGDCDDDDGSVIVPTWYYDFDEDTYGDPSVTIDDCAQPSGYVGNSDDCDDTDKTIYDGASELCDGQDNDCDGSLDATEEDDDSDFYVECTIDGDGWDGDSSIIGGEDCDDGRQDSNPGAKEFCDGTHDDDCDGTVDEDTAVDASTWYLDDDGDGYGDSTSSTVACDQPSDYVTDSSDCDDGDGDTYPNAAEVCGDGVINDCKATSTDECGPYDSWGLGQAQLVIDGVANQDQAGEYVAGGDADGDGATDVLLIAEDGVFVFLGPVSGSTDLGSADYTIEGVTSSGTPSVVEVVADLTGDGNEDLVASDYSENTSWILEGPLTGNADVSDAVAIFEGQSFWAMGWVVDVADVSGDGTPDLTMAAPTYSKLVSKGGAIGIWNGPITGQEYTWLPSGGVQHEEPDTVIWATDGSSLLGTDLLQEDLDGDGTADLLAGGPGSDAGYGWLIYGPLSTSDSVQALADVELSGQVSGDAFGAHLSTGDHNDDGYTDLGVSATYAGSKRGYAYFYNGTATGWSSTLVPGDAEATVRGPTDSEMSPLALDGDINDDGFDDLVIGAPQTPTTNTKGRVYFLQGPLTGTLYASVDRVGVWTGEANGDQATYFRGLVSAGDVNGDGYADTLVGAPYHNTVNRGAAYLMLGGPNY